MLPRWTAALLLAVTQAGGAETRITADTFIALPAATLERSYEASFTVPKEPMANALLTFSIERKAPEGTAGLFDLFLMDGDVASYLSSRVVKPQRASGVSFDVTAPFNQAVAQERKTIRFRVSNLSSADHLVPSLTLDLGRPPQIRCSFSPGGPPTEGALVPAQDEGKIVAESVLPIRSAGGDTSCRLLYPPTKILAVFSPLTGKVYAADVDYTATSDGLGIPSGSSIKPLDENRLFTKGTDGLRSFPLNDGRHQLAPEGRWWNEQQIAVTYLTSATEPVEPTPPPDSFFQTLHDRLQAGQSMNLVILGDSISAGSNASSLDALAPYAATWAEQLTEKFRLRWKGASITLKNLALPGMDSSWGRDHAAFFFAHAPPDLLVVAFGMNDRERISPEKFRENIHSVIQAARKANPHCAIILVSSMRNNPLWGDQKNLDLFREHLRSLTGPSIRLADMTTTTDRLLQRKTYYDLTGNGVNHPNDYLIRWYADRVERAFHP